VPHVTRRYTTTSRVCPMRYARSTDCESDAGFQTVVQQLEIEIKTLMHFFVM
jgi:hypothetical protein